MTNQIIQLPDNAFVHIDKIVVTGPCRHRPLGHVFYSHSDEDGFVPAGTSAPHKQRRHNTEETRVRSKDLRGDGFAHQLDINCCPPKVLQGHNVFGHSDMLAYVNSVFDRTTKLQSIDVDPAQREDWKSGAVWLTEVHLTANFHCPAGSLVEIIDAIDEDTATGKHRDHETAITLGYTPKGRSKHHMLSIYGKWHQLQAGSKRPSLLLTTLLAYCFDSLRAEVKLFSEGLKHRKLQYAANWNDVDVAGLFFEILRSYKVTSAVQPLLTEDELQMLTLREQNVYRLWLTGVPVDDQFKSRSTVWQYIQSIRDKTGIDISGRRRPERLPEVDLAEIFTPENIMPIPQWAFGTEYYSPPK